MLSNPRVRVADEVWIAAASLHRSHPQAPDFTIAEIMAQAKSANVTGVKPLRPSVKIHIYLHCVANRPPNPSRYRMLVETATGRRRLFRPGDPCHPRRSSGKDAPKRHDLPSAYDDLIDWYEDVYAAGASGTAEDPILAFGVPGTAEDPILALRGVGSEVWADEDADAYVHRQRKGWQ